MPDEGRLISACGIDCTDCDIRRAPADLELQSTISQWFKEKRNLDVKPEAIRCSWCRGDRADHWSADCWILHCCVDEKGLAHCSQCADFPCSRLIEWAKQDKGYGRAFARLQAMRSASG
ncbi:MAG: DUF3795 domain-containing protein [Candidatus Bipolaricaulota bacterium]